MSGSLPEIPANAEGLDPRLSPQQRELYRYAERWLAQNRHLAPGNDSVALMNPRPSYGGITCDVVRVTCISQELFALFQNLSPDSTPVTGTMDEETGGNLYRVTIPFLEVAAEKYAESNIDHIEGAMDRSSSRGPRSQVSKGSPFVNERSGRTSRATSFSRTEPNFYAVPETKSFSSATPIPVRDTPSIQVMPPPKSVSVSRDRRIKLGEQLSAHHDLSEVEEFDKPSILALIYTVVTMEEDTPQVTLKVNRQPGYYALIFRDFNCNVDLIKAYRVLVAEPDPKIPPVMTVHFNPHTGSLIIRASRDGTSKRPVDSIDVRNKKRYRSDDSTGR